MSAFDIKRERNARRNKDKMNNAIRLLSRTTVPGLIHRREMATLERDKAELLQQKYQERILYDEMKPDYYLRDANLGHYDTTANGMAVARNVLAVDEMRRDRNRQDKLVQKSKFNAESRNVKAVLKSLEGLSEPQKNKILKDHLNYLNDVNEVDLMGQFIPFNKRKDSDFIQAQQASIEQQTRNSNERRKKRREEMVARQAEAEEAYNQRVQFINSQRPLPPASILSARQVAAAQAAAGGLSNIRPLRPFNEQELMDAGYAVPAQEEEEEEML